MDNLIDRQLGGKYQIQSEIGRGGMGIVYRAFDQNLRRSVALKVLAPQLTVDPDFVQRFRHEAIAAANLHHPNIVIIHDVGANEVEDWPGRSLHFIVMEYVDGVTLDQWLMRRRGPMPLNATVKVVQQVSSALQFAHDRGLIHRDIKPSNIMLDDAGQVKLMDFGLVRAGELSHLTRSGTVLGTPQYMAPEQIVGGQVDRRTDIYSLGVVIYELLAGEVPFARTTPMATAYAHVNEPPPPLRQRQAITPKSVEAVVMKALAKDPAARYQTTTLLAQDFNVAASGVMPAGLAEYDPARVMATKTATQRRNRASKSPPPPTRERSRKTGLILAIVAVLLILLLGGSAIVFNRIGDSDDDMAVKPFTASSIGAPTVVAMATTSPTLSDTRQPTDQPAHAHATDSPPPLTTDSRATTPMAAAATDTSTVSTPTKKPPPATAAPTSTHVPTRPPAKNAGLPAVTSTPTTGLAASVRATEVTPPTQPPTPSPEVTPCPPYLRQALAGMGLLLIENHLGEGLHVDWPATQQQWDIPAKQGDVPGRLVLDMPPGKHDLNDNTGRGGFGHIGLVVEAGKAYVSPIWYNDRAEELVYPLVIPNGCR